MDSSPPPLASPSPLVMHPTPTESRWLIAIVCMGVTLRVMLLIFRSGDLKTDPDAYVALAETLRETGGFSVPQTDQPTAFRPPLYPMILAALRLTGLKMTVVIGLVNVMAGAVLMISAWWLSRAVGLSRHWPTIAATVVGLDPMMLRYTALPMTEVLSGALLTVAVLQLLKARLFERISNTHHSPALRPWKSAVVAGVFFGLAGLCRPVALVTCAVLTIAQAIGFCWRTFRARQRADVDSPPLERSGASSVAVAVPAMVAGLILMPWIIRNAVQFNSFLPATTHGGYTLLLGNNEVFYDEVVNAAEQPVWQGNSLDRWQQSLRAEMNAGHVRGEVEIDRWNYSKAMATIRSRPGDFATACVLRWTRFWALRPTVDVSTTATGGASILVGAWYAVLWLGLLASAVFSLIRRPADIQLLWLSVLSFLVLHSFYWTNARMRAPLMGILSVLAVIGWRFLWELRRAKSQPDPVK